MYTFTHGIQSRTETLHWESVPRNIPGHEYNGTFVKGDRIRTSAYGLNLSFIASDGNIMFRVSSDSSEGKVVRNARYDGNWGKEESDGAWPFAGGSRSGSGQQVTIEMRDDGWYFSVDGTRYPQFDFLERQTAYTRQSGTQLDKLDVAKIIGAEFISKLKTRDFRPNDRGGTCTCPDGREFLVGDSSDDCQSLACHGGSAGACTSGVIPVSLRGWGVACHNGAFAAILFFLLSRVVFANNLYANY